MIPIPGLNPIRYEDVNCLPTYANMLLANGLAIVPRYGIPEDAHVLNLMTDLGYEAYGIDARKVVESNAVFHCMSKCIPGVPVQVPGSAGMVPGPSAGESRI
ncbi:MAG TPA: agmatine deiminase family protein [bacterium]|nr:agmatine deiminase family protein [bacterium]